MRISGGLTCGLIFNGPELWQRGYRRAGSFRTGKIFFMAVVCEWKFNSVNREQLWSFV